MPQAVFKVETSGGVLIVVPRGDAVGFRESDVHDSVKAVADQIDNLNPPLVVVDLGSSGYFGSVIIGAVVSFAEEVERKGGALAVCHLSSDMQGVFKVMRLGECMKVCDTRQEAVQAVKTPSS